MNIFKSSDKINDCRQFENIKPHSVLKDGWKVMYILDTVQDKTADEVMKIFYDVISNAGLERKMLHRIKNHNISFDEIHEPECKLVGILEEYSKKIE